MKPLEDLQQSIQNIIKQEMPAIVTCDLYPSIRKAIPAPAVFIELSSIEPGQDPGTGELAVIVTIEARIVIDNHVEQAELQIQNLAADLARLVHRNQWGLEVSPAEFISATPDAFKADLDAYLVWQVTWQHQLHLGEAIWKDSDIAAHTIYVGFAPYIGEPHEDKYQELADGSGV